MKFKNGDRVKLISCDNIFNHGLCVGMTGTVVAFSYGSATVDWDDLASGQISRPSYWAVCENKIALISPVKFYMVKAEGNNATSHIHDTLLSAQNEAERLAHKEQGKKFFIMEAVGFYEVEPPPSIYHAL